MAGSGSIQSYQLSAQLILDARERAEARFNFLSMTHYLRAFSLVWVSTKSGEVQFGFLGESGHVVIPLIRASKSAKVERMSSKLAGSERYMSRIAW